MRILIALLSILLSASAWSANLKTMEDDWTWQSLYSKVTSVTVSTVTPVSDGYVGFSYAILPVGANASWTVDFTTRTFSPPSVAVASITTVGHTLPNGIMYSSEFDALTMNPAIVLYDLSAAATYYVYMTYGERRKN